MQKINNKYIKSIVYQALKEDLEPSGDITTKNINDKKVLAKIIAGQNCIIGGINFAKETTLYSVPCGMIIFSMMMLCSIKYSSSAALYFYITIYNFPFSP